MSFRIDKGLLLAVLFFIGFGLVQVYSSSFIYAIEKYDDGLFFFRRQLMFSFASLAILFIMAKLPWSFVSRLGLVFWFLAVAGIMATFHPSLAIKVGGATRWVQMPFGLRFEPAELLKVSFPFLAAFFITNELKFLGRWKNYIFAALTGSVLYLLLKQPDFGSFILCSLIIFSMLFTFGLKWRYIVGGVAAAIPVIYFLIVNVPYRYARVVTYLDPWSDPTNKGFQIIQSLLSFHSGGFWGAGLGQGQGKLFFLPEAHTDFTLAVLGEELGFFGFLLVILLYGFIVYRGFQISIKAKDLFAKAVAIGLTVAFGLSVFINVGVVLGLLPTKGLTLPFLSYGGSSLVSSTLLVAILLNIDRANSIENKKESFSGLSL